MLYAIVPIGLKIKNVFIQNQSKKILKYESKNQKNSAVDGCMFPFRNVLTCNGQCRDLGSGCSTVNEEDYGYCI